MTSRIQRRPQNHRHMKTRLAKVSEPEGFTSKAYVKPCPFCGDPNVRYGMKPQNLLCACGAELRYGNWIKP